MSNVTRSKFGCEWMSQIDKLFFRKNLYFAYGQQSGRKAGGMELITFKSTTYPLLMANMTFELIRTPYLQQPYPCPHQLGGCGDMPSLAFANG